MDNIKYGPSELPGREFKADFTWVYVSFGNKMMYCKVDPTAIEDIAAGKPFLAYNPWSMSDKGFVYLPAISMTIEPMFITGANMMSFVHYKVADDLDRMTKEAFSMIALPPEKEVKPVSNLILG